MKRGLIILGVFFLLAPHAHASTQVIVGSSGAGTTANGSDNSIFGAGANNNSFNELNAMPFAGTISNLYVYIPTQGGGSSTRTLTIRKNKAAGSTVTCTIGAAANTCTDTVHSLSFVAGDSIDISTVTTNTPIATELRWSVTMTPTNANNTAIGTNDPNNGSAGWGFFLPYASGPTISTLANISRSHAVLPEAGTIDTLYATSTNSFLVGSYTYTLMQNDATTTVACTTGSDFLGCSDLAHSLTIAQGDTFSLNQATSSAGANSRAGFGVRYLPTTPGDFVFIMDNTGSDSIGTFFLPITGGQAQNAIEASTTQVVGSAITISSMSINRTVGPGAGKNVVFTLRVNGQDSSLTCTLTGAGTGAGVSTKTCTGSVNVVAGDLLAWSEVLDASGTAGTLTIGIVASVPSTTVSHSIVKLLNATWRILSGGRVLIL